ncbi:MAG: hypothetical protein ACQEVA_12790 [Myxococcota bacterium]
MMSKMGPKLAHLESEGERQRRRLERTLQRFEHLVEEVAESARRPLMALASELVDVDSRLSERERAMIELALIGTPEALRVLEWFDPQPYPPRLHLLQKVCLGECRRRRRRDEIAGRQAA